VAASKKSQLSQGDQDKIKIRRQVVEGFTPAELTPKQKQQLKSSVTLKSLSDIRRISTDTRRRVRDALRTSIAGGETAQIAANRIIAEAQISKGTFGNARKRALAIARTQLHNARQVVSVKTYEKTVSFFVWISVLLAGRTCPRCRSLHGQVKKLSTWQKLGLPALHPFCLCVLIPGRKFPTPDKPLSFTSPPVERMAVKRRLLVAPDVKGTNITKVVDRRDTNTGRVVTRDQNIDRLGVKNQFFKGKDNRFNGIQTSLSMKQVLGIQISKRFSAKRKARLISQYHTGGFEGINQVSRELGLWVRYDKNGAKYLAIPRKEYDVIQKGNAVRGETISSLRRKA